MLHYFTRENNDLGFTIDLSENERFEEGDDNSESRI